MPHLYAPDDWIDAFRIVLFAVSAYSAILLVLRYRKLGKSWNIKTKDYWFGQLMWSLAGCELVIQGIALNRPFTPATVLITAGILATAKAVHRKGGWGSNAS